jgi:hypothetical protein
MTMTERDYGRAFGRADRSVGQAPTVNLNKSDPDEFESGYIEGYRDGAGPGPRAARRPTPAYRPVELT